MTISSVLTNNYPVLIIPAYNPDYRLLDLLKEHKRLYGKQHCLIVNDGSKKSSLSIFNQLEIQGYKILHHERNQGKGLALKTAMFYYLNVFPDSSGIITADADGQHCIEDIIALSEQFRKKPENLHLGVRHFTQSEIPLRSRMGNGITKFLFNYLTGSQIKDTQTGLRGIPKQLIYPLIKTSTTRYDFEFEMFFIAKKNQVQIAQLPIKTIYFERNRGSHFNPLLDSLRIYYLFLRYGLAFLGARLKKNP